MPFGRITSTAPDDFKRAVPLAEAGDRPSGHLAWRPLSCWQIPTGDPPLWRAMCLYSRHAASVHSRRRPGPASVGEYERRAGTAQSPGTLSRISMGLIWESDREPCVASSFEHSDGENRPSAASRWKHARVAIDRIDRQGSCPLAASAARSGVPETSRGAANSHGELARPAGLEPATPA